MILVALETSTSRGGVALWRDGQVDHLHLPDSPHSGTLLPAVDALLAAASLGREQVEALAVGVGPGAFTGLRVGIATASGWARAAGIPVIAVPSLDAVALPLLREGKRAAVVADARKGEFYAAFYRRLSPRGLPERVGETLLLGPPALLRWIKELPPGTMLTGTGLPTLPPLPAALRLGTYTDEGPRPEEVARLGALLLAEGKGTGADGLSPLYVRPPDALLPPPSFLPPR